MVKANLTTTHGKKEYHNLLNIDETLKKDFTSIFVSDNDNFDTMFLQNSKKDMMTMFHIVMMN